MEKEKKERSVRFPVVAVIGIIVVAALAVVLMLWGGGADKPGKISEGVADLPSTQVAAGGQTSDAASASNDEPGDSGESGDSGDSGDSDRLVEPDPSEPDVGGASLGGAGGGEIVVDMAGVVDELVDGKLFHAVVNTDIVMVSGGLAEMGIQNLADSEYPCYVVIEEIVEKSETGSDTLMSLYDSAVVDPGYRLESDKLMSRLSSGVHECVAGFFVLDSEGGAIQRIDVPVTITSK